MKRKINCPYHDDKTASMQLYEEAAHCFGCGAHVSIGQLEKKVGKLKTYPFKAQMKEDIPKALERIKTLPTKMIRGFELPYDSRGYYILYPGPFYTLRKWKPTADHDKYYTPVGHRKPMYRPRCGKTSDTLVVVEGQLNARSIFAAWEEPDKFDVVSPGSAQDLNRPEFVEYYLQYDRIIVIIDKDPAGVVAGITLRDNLLTHKKRVTLHPMKEDASYVYETQGKEALRKQLQDELDLP